MDPMTWMAGPMSWMWGGWGIGMMLITLGFWAVVIVGIALGIRWLVSQGKGSHQRRLGRPERRPGPAPRHGGVSGGGEPRLPRPGREQRALGGCRSRWPARSGLWA